MQITMLNGPLGCGCQDQPENQIYIQGLGQPPIINWNTEPDKSADGREVEWTAGDWVEWHKKIAAKYGVERANEVTNQWWERLPWYDTRKVTWWLDCAFYNYFRNAGGGWSSLIPSLVCTIDNSGGKLIESAGEVVENVAAAASSVSAGAKNTGKVLSWLVPLLVVGVVAGGGAYVYKNYIKGNDKIKLQPSLRGTNKPKRRSKYAK